MTGDDESERARPPGTTTKIRHEDRWARVDSEGAALLEYGCADRLVIGGPGGPPLRSSRGMPLAPWPNRIRDGRYAFNGFDHQLPLNEPDLGNAIHGLTRTARWGVAEKSPTAVVLTTQVSPLPGYPFRVDVRVEYRVCQRGLIVRTSARNVGSQPAPLGLGHHPYLATEADVVDDATLHIPAARVLLTGRRGLPGASVPVNVAALDFRQPSPVGARPIDACFTDFDRSDGVARVTIDRSMLWFDAAYPWLMIYMADRAPIADRRRWLAVEPMTCPPDAFNTGVDVIRLDPGAMTSATWGID